MRARARLTEIAEIGQVGIRVVPVELESAAMTTTPSEPWGDERGSLPHRLPIREKILSRRQARRLSRRFAGVGVDIPAQRLQEIAAGAPTPDDEMTDVYFAFAAVEITREERAAKFARRQRRGFYWLMVTGLVLVVLNLLLCMAYVFFSLTQQAF